MGKDRQTREDRMHLLKDYLHRYKGQEFCATELLAATGIKKTLVRKALTVNGDQVTPIEGISMEEKYRPGAKLQGKSFWFSARGD
jgi:hypothetical protein